MFPERVPLVTLLSGPDHGSTVPTAEGHVGGLEGLVPWPLARFRFGRGTWQKLSGNTTPFPALVPADPRAYRDP